MSHATVTELPAWILAPTYLIEHESNGALDEWLEQLNLRIDLSKDTIKVTTDINTQLDGLTDAWLDDLLTYDEYVAAAWPLARQLFEEAAP